MLSHCLFRYAEVALCMQSRTLDHTRVHKSYTSPCMHSCMYTHIHMYRHTVIVCVYSMNIIYTQEASSHWCCVVPPNCVRGGELKGPANSRQHVDILVSSQEVKEPQLQGSCLALFTMMYYCMCVVASYCTLDIVYHMCGSF